MLVLTRRKNEGIIIGDNINIVVVEIRDDKVRLGIDVPNEVSVHRREVYDAITREQGAPQSYSPEETKREKVRFTVDLPVDQKVYLEDIARQIEQQSPYFAAQRDEVLQAILDAVMDKTGRPREIRSLSELRNAVKT